MTTPTPYKNHLSSADDLVTTYEATRAGFVSLALEKNRRATPFVAEARVLQEASSIAKTPWDLLKIESIEAGILTAAGVSDKAVSHLMPDDKIEAVKGLIKNYLEPAGAKFVEELVFRFLLTRGDTLGGSMRNVGGALAQRKLTRSILAALKVSGIAYHWLHNKNRKWTNMTDEDSEIELSLRGLYWERKDGPRTLIYNLTVPIVKNNVDLCLFGFTPKDLDNGYDDPNDYLAIGELKGGIDPAGADEHWKTARTALDRVRKSFSEYKVPLLTFFVGAAIEKKMATEIWEHLTDGTLSNAANLNEEKQIASIAAWLLSL